MIKSTQAKFKLSAAQTYFCIKSTRNHTCTFVYLPLTWCAFVEFVANVWFDWLLIMVIKIKNRTEHFWGLLTGQILQHMTVTEVCTRWSCLTWEDQPHFIDPAGPKVFWSPHKVHLNNDNKSLSIMSYTAESKPLIWYNTWYDVICGYWTIILCICPPMPALWELSRPGFWGCCTPIMLW